MVITLDFSFDDGGVVDFGGVGVFSSLHQITTGVVTTMLLGPFCHALVIALLSYATAPSVRPACQFLSVKEC